MILLLTDSMQDVAAGSCSGSGGGISSGRQAGRSGARLSDGHGMSYVSRGQRT
jgi:hypothetical protein